MATDTYYMDEEVCTHQNKEYFTEAEKREGHTKMSGYCIDCGEPFSDDLGNGESSGGCTHPTVKEDVNGVNVCTVCFVEMTEQLSFEPEWNRYSDSSSSRSSKDPSRCHGQRGPVARGCLPFFEDLKIPIDKARLARIDEKYRVILSKSTSKGHCRKGIIAACMFRDLRNCGETRTTDYVRNQCSISKKRMSEGLSIYYECFPEESKDYITATDLIPWLMDVIGIDRKHEDKIKLLAERLIKNDPTFNRATPQAVASSIIYFFLCLNPPYKKSLGMNKTKFAEKSELSDLTITKLVNAIAEKTKCKIEI